MTRAVYVETDERLPSPYHAWLEVTTEKAQLEGWLLFNLLRFALAIPKAHPISVLDLGCGSGHMSLRLMRTLDTLHIPYTYTGVDPYEEQLTRFSQDALAQEVPLPRLIPGRTESYQIISTADEVGNALAHIDLKGRALERHDFLSRADISACLEEGHASGEALLAFFFEGPFSTLSSSDVVDIRAFLRRQWGPDLFLLHEDTIFVVR